MNKKELVEKYEHLNHECFRRVDTSEVLKDLQQLDEPQTAKVPQFVAEYIEWTKEEDLHLLGAMSRGNFDKKLEDWFYTGDNMELFARAWLDGYEIEKEKRYLLKMKGICGNHETLNCKKYSNEWLFSSSEENRTYKTKFTRKELEEAGFGWVFNCPGIEIEEVEE